MALCLIQVVAVKQLDRNGFQGNREFLVEVLMLSLLHNQYLVNLVGYCAEGPKRLLVYEYMEKGSLEDHLLGNAPMSQLLNISVAVVPCFTIQIVYSSRIETKAKAPKLADQNEDSRGGSKRSGVPP